MALPAAQPILVHGHRGARAVLPENTLPAFEYAIEIGADVLELDLAVTKDNVLVVSHDPTLNPKFCQGPGGSNVIRELTLEELRRWDCGARANPDFPKQKAVPGTPVPTLDEVFALARRGTFQFNVETKIFKDKPWYTPPPEEFAKLLVDAIRRHKLESRTIVQSFDYRTLHAVKKLAPEIRRSALYAVGFKSFPAIAQESEATIVSPHHRLVTKKRVEAAHSAGLQVVPWTANDPSDWERLIAAGVDGIITDDPAALIQYLKSRNLR
ncbi:MAG: glycerophosphodiester phosphodiesterase [Bryobacteraceae bacterium]|nr:glycerophosphodiester phosphodiesterase [Bryobacteraceae bacterium]